MAKIVEYREIPLDDLVIGKGQVRTHETSKGIDELARSIDVQGLLQPIIVCAANEEGRWEILAGQRRFLAHKYLKKDVISAAVFDERVDEKQAKTISITENLMRRKLSGKELKDGILYLYNLYGTIKDVVIATGLPQNQVRDYIKYPRLIKELKELVDDGSVDVNAALKAQDASLDDKGEPDTDVAVTLAKEMHEMTGVLRKRITQVREEHPEMTIDEVIERARSGSRVVQIVVSVTQSTHAAVQRFAIEEDRNQDDAVAILIDEALVSRGILED